MALRTADRELTEERFCKILTRDTPGWLMLSWQARALLLFLMRRADGAGLISLRGRGLGAVALIVGMPEELVRKAIYELERNGDVRWVDGDVFLPEHYDIQRAKLGLALRSRLHRERQRSRTKLREKITGQTGASPHLAHDPLDDIENNELDACNGSDITEDDDSGVDITESDVKQTLHSDDNEIMQSECKNATCSDSVGVSCDATQSDMSAVCENTAEIATEEGANEPVEEPVDPEKSPLPPPTPPSNPSMSSLANARSDDLNSQISFDLFSGIDQETDLRDHDLSQQSQEKHYKARARESKAGAKAQAKAEAEAKLAGDHRTFVMAFDELYRAHRSGAKPSWGKKQGGMVQRLLKAHGLAECLLRARRLFAMFDRNEWPAQGGDLQTLVQHFDKFAVSAPSGTLRPGRRYPRGDQL